MFTPVQVEITSYEPEKVGGMSVFTLLTHFPSWTAYAVAYYLFTFHILDIFPRTVKFD